MKVNYEMISIQNSCIPQGLSSNWDKLYNVQLIQKGLALRKVFIISKGTCKLQSVQQMYEIFPKTISWTFLLLKVKVSCRGVNGNVFQLKLSFWSIVWKDFNREEKSLQMYITLPWQQNFSISTNHYPANMAGKKMTELTSLTSLCMIVLRNKTVAHAFVLSFNNVNGSLCQERLLRSLNLAAMVT